jgi:1,4-dihydroxy-2-naphthoate octaprenyltransferase
MHKGGHARTNLDLHTLLLAVRPWSFTMTAISVTVGSLLALPAFNGGLYLLVLVGMIAVHAATNLINDYFDVRHGVDRPDAPTARYRPHPLLTGALHPRWALWGAFALYGVAALIGLYLTLTRGWPIAVIAVLGGLASFFYTAGPIQYKHRALGEFSVFWMWGPLMLLGAYYVQTGGWDQTDAVIWASLPIGLWVALVLLANNMKDIDYDRTQGVTTLGTLLGRRRALQLYTLLIVIVYLLSGLAVAIRALPPWALLVFLSLPMAWRLVRSLGSASEIPPDADPRTAQLATLFGFLLIVALLLHHFLPWR